MWLSSGQKDYTSVNVSSTYSDYDNSKTRRRQSCWRVICHLICQEINIDRAVISILLADLKNQLMESSCVTHILPFCGYFKGQEQTVKPY